MPRSGSAWLANFLTDGRCFCAHEPLADGHIDWSSGAVSGAICTAAALAGFKPPEGVRTYSLSRDPDAVNRSLVNSGLPAMDLSMYPTGGFVYERLFDIDYLESIWAEVVGLSFNKRRAEMLIEMNVQRDLSKLFNKLREGQR